jgi:hypothetical protein
MGATPQCNTQEMMDGRHTTVQYARDDGWAPHVLLLCPCSVLRVRWDLWECRLVGDPRRRSIIAEPAHLREHCTARAHTRRGCARGTCASTCQVRLSAWKECVSVCEMIILRVGEVMRLCWVGRGHFVASSAALTSHARSSTHVHSRTHAQSHSPVGMHVGSD